MATHALMMLGALGLLMAPVQELKLPGAHTGSGPSAGVRAKGPGGCTGNLSLLARQSVLGALPVGYRLLAVRVENACVPLSEGRLRCEAQLPATLLQGTNAVTLTCAGRSKQRYALDAQMDLQATTPAKAAVVIARGADVKIVVRTGNVTVQAAAVAQESAGLGEQVQVLPNGATRVVRGRVLDARTVEVTL